MTYELALGDRTYSSWSLRGWLLFAKFDLPVTVHTARMKSDAFTKMLADFAPARLVPAARLDGTVVWDTFAIAEELATRHPDANLWPTDPSARAHARSLSAEMHAGFGDLRTDCTMNLRHIYPDYSPSDAVKSDCARIDRILSDCLEQYANDGPWLFGDYSIADVFYAPAMTRFVTYNLPCSDRLQAYINTHLTDKSFRQWRAMGIAENYTQPGYDLDLEAANWPTPTLDAHAVDTGTPENTHCPYSGKPVKHLMQINNRTFGTCNPFCRDKTIADPMVWDAFVGIYG